MCTRSCRANNERIDVASCSDFAVTVKYQYAPYQVRRAPRAARKLLLLPTAIRCLPGLVSIVAWHVCGQPQNVRACLPAQPHTSRGLGRL